METKFKYYHVIITECTKTNKDFLKLYSIFRNTLNPEMTFREFYNYYFSEKLDYIDVTFFYCNGILSGFCSASFYKIIIDGKNTALGRAATGIVSEYQKKGMPKLTLFLKYVRYKYHHPFTKLVISAFIANALIYAMICKYTAWVWPRVNSAIPGYVETIKMEIVNNSKTAVAAAHPYVVKINFNVTIGSSLLERIYSSNSKHVHYFLQVNPCFYNQQCVVIIVPFTWLNLLLSVLLFIFYSFKKAVVTKAKNIQHIWPEIFSFTGNGLQKNKRPDITL